jgi:hypothetical protein
MREKREQVDWEMPHKEDSWCGGIDCRPSDVPRKARRPATVSGGVKEMK